MQKTLISKICGAYVVKLDRHHDQRGYFQEVCSKVPVEQVNVSHSYRNVVRGLHVAPFSKSCTCLRGCLFDVIADVRKDSPTFGKWFGIWLTDQNCKQVYVPAGCAHGFFTAENETILLYHQDGLYDPSKEYVINWRDPRLGIKWPYAEEYVLSERDRTAKGLADVV